MPGTHLRVASSSGTAAVNGRCQETMPLHPSTLALKNVVVTASSPVDAKPSTMVKGSVSCMTVSVAMLMMETGCVATENFKFFCECTCQ